MKKAFAGLITMLLMFAVPLIARSAEIDTPFTQVIVGSCLIEDIAVVGIIHTSTKITSLRDGGVRIDVTDRTKGNATGLESGVKYNVVGKITQRYILSSTTLESFSYKSGFALVGPGPDNNLTINYIFKQLGDTVVVDNFVAGCK